MKPSGPVIRYHGGKFRIASWVLQFFPPHRCYVEPFGGAAGVLVQKPRSYAEVYNDLDGDVVNLFRCLQDPEQRQRLIELCVLTPYARSEFEIAYQPCADPVERARRLVIRAQMGFGSDGATKNTTGFRVDTKREYGTAQQIWQLYPDNLRTVGQRLTGVLIENKPAVEVMLYHDGPDVLHYVDPPYLHDLRIMSGKCYRHEMSKEDHLELLEAVLSLTGMVVLSGYCSDLYEDALRGWIQRKKVARAAAGRGGTTRVECLWISPSCWESLTDAQGDLFDVV